MNEEITLEELTKAYGKVRESLDTLGSIPDSDFDIEGTVEVSEKFAFRIQNQKVLLEIYTEDKDGYKDFTTVEILHDNIPQAVLDITKG